MSKKSITTSPNEVLKVINDVSLKAGVIHNTVNNIIPDTQYMIRQIDTIDNMISACQNRELADDLMITKEALINIVDSCNTLALMVNNINRGINEISDVQRSMVHTGFINTDNNLEGRNIHHLCDKLRYVDSATCNNKDLMYDRIKKYKQRVILSNQHVD